MSLEGSWVVESLAVAGELVPPIEGGKPLRLDVSDGRVSGSAGINRFMGQLGDDKPFPTLATTMMAGPEELMSQERILLEHYQSVDAVEASSSASPSGSSTGILLLSEGLVVVTLCPAGTNDLVGTS